MRIGLNLPQGYFNEFDGWEPVKAWRRILEIAELGAKLGFESLWTGEHVLSKWGGPASISFDFYTLAVAIAAQVPKVEIGCGVVNSTFHNPALMAKQMATLDVVSDGRVVLGLGAGFKENEARAFGFDYPSLKERLAQRWFPGGRCNIAQGTQQPQADGDVALRVGVGGGHARPNRADGGSGVLLGVVPRGGPLRLDQEALAG